MSYEKSPHFSVYSCFWFGMQILRQNLMVDGSGLMRRVELTEVNMHIEYLEFCGCLLVAQHFLVWVWSSVHFHAFAK